MYEEIISNSLGQQWLLLLLYSTGDVLGWNPATAMFVCPPWLTHILVYVYALSKGMIMDVTWVCTLCNDVDYIGSI